MLKSKKTERDVVGGLGSMNMEQLIIHAVAWSSGGRSHDHSSASE